MKSLKKMAELADRFEHKLQKYADDVDSTSVTMSVRPVVNKILRAANINAKLGNILKGAWAKNNALSGDVNVGGDYFITNAKKVGGRWVVDPLTSTLPYSLAGDLKSDQAVSTQVDNLIKGLNAAIVAALNVEFNRVAANWEGDTITNHQTGVDPISTGI